jgi:hypothetical protein
MAALACLAGCSMAELNKSPSGTAAPSSAPTSPPGTVTPGAGTADPRQERLAAVSWPADGVSAADISGIGVVAGPDATRAVPIGCVLIAAWHRAGAHNTLIVAATFGQPGTAQTILPNALQAGHMLVLALDRALGPSRRVSGTGP